MLVYGECWTIAYINLSLHTPQFTILHKNPHFHTPFVPARPRSKSTVLIVAAATVTQDTSALRRRPGTFILEHVGEIMAAMMIYNYNIIIIADVRHYLTYMFYDKSAGVLVEAYKGTRRKHNMKFRQISHTTSQYGQSFLVHY